MKKFLITLAAVLLICQGLYAGQQRVQSEKEVMISENGQNGDLDRTQLRDRDYEDNESLKEQDRDRLRTRDRIRDCFDLKNEQKRVVQVRKQSANSRKSQKSKGR